jgi:hypothetical protein
MNTQTTAKTGDGFGIRKHRMLMHLGKDINLGSYNCHFTEAEELAKKFLEVVQQFNGKGHLYKAVKVQ